MRKRVQRKIKSTFEESKNNIQKREEKKRSVFENKIIKFKKNHWTAITLICIFFIVLFMNSYFNISSDVAINEEAEGIDKYYLSGPDPYYNRRLVETTLETGEYPYYSERDPLLNYPIGANGARAPLFNMISIGFSRLLTPFMDEVDAIGRSMQFIPALFGALLIFPVYFIGKILFNRKTGLYSALFIAIIPIHLGSGHGSAYSLFDHDSFNLLLFFLTFLFLILSLKEKNTYRSIFYAILAGIPLAGLSMTWVEARYLYVIIAIYAFTQFIIDIFTNKIEKKIFLSTTIILFTGYLVSLPVIATKPGGISFDSTLLLCIAVAIFGIIYYLFGIAKIPWTLSLPLITLFTSIGIVFLYFVTTLSESITFFSPLKSLSRIVFGEGIYGNKVSMTIAEANTYQISNTVMSFGPALYWMAWVGFIILSWYYIRDKGLESRGPSGKRRDYLFIIVLFIVNIWLSGVAGRFLNDMVPLIAILAGWMTWILVTRIDYRQMLRNIRIAGKGFYGIKRGIKFIHIFGILFLSFIIIIPNVYISFDAAVPSKTYQIDNENYSNYKWDMFGEKHIAAFGLGVGKESYWTEALLWLKEQDSDILESINRPAFISWWDYGFYAAALSEHPTVADNFQDGIPPAANFHTATSEEEAVMVLIIRLIEGNKQDYDGKISDDVIQVLNTHLGNKNASKVINWIESPTISPSYDKPIRPEYDKELSKDYPIGQQWPDNAYYQDIISLLIKNEDNNLTDQEITMLYHDIQEATGYSIRYYGVEGYDRQIFNIFAFLSDKSLLLVGAPEDDFIEMWYSGYTVDSQGNVVQDDQEWSAKELEEMDDKDKRFIRVTSQNPKPKDLYYDTIFYRTYIGPSYSQQEGVLEEWPGVNLPCQNMRHFYGEFISKYPYYDTGKSAVVIAKYYEGAIVNGTIIFNGKPVNNTDIIVQKNLTYPIFSDNRNITINHDQIRISYEGIENASSNFSLIMGADANLVIRRYFELGEFGFVVKNITFDSQDNPLYYPITDDVAMRKTDDWVRELGNISIEPGNISGFVYNDNENNSIYDNETGDSPIGNADVLIYKVLEFDQQEFQKSGSLKPISAPFESHTTTSEKGYYNFKNLIPGYYILTVFTDEFIIYNNLIKIFSGNNTENVAKPENANIGGKAYYDDNKDDIYTSGEELSNAQVTLLYSAIEEQPLTEVQNITTDDEGNYEFQSLIPGTYTIRVLEGKNYTTELTVSLAENTTKIFNISAELFPVTVKGKTIFDGNPISDIELLFERNESIKDNTAEDSIIITETDGKYSVDLTPGTYNISVEKYDEDNPDVLVYTLENKSLVFEVGEGIRTDVNFELEKRSINVSGEIIYPLDSNIIDVGIRFIKDDSIEYNNATDSQLISTNSSYELELSAGFYNVSLTTPIFEIDGLNYSYVLDNSSNYLSISDEDVLTGKSFDIELILIEND
jgi:dolichyl-diphosphooligosaccharide--protein glycosyltransferase